MEVVEGRATVEDVDAFLDELGAIGERYDATIQAFDARYIVDRDHLALAVRLATRAHEREDAIANDLAMEILCYAAGRRQIQDALAMGVSPGTGPVVIVVDGGDEAAAVSEVRDDLAAAAVSEVRDDLAAAATLGRFDEELVRTYFDIGADELAATSGSVADLVRERVALLAVEK